MTQPEWLKGIAVFAVVTAAALLSMPYADRYVASVAPVKTEPAEPGVVCVEPDGSYRNWPFPNTPMLSPKCDPEK